MLLRQSRPRSPATHGTQGRVGWGNNRMELDLTDVAAMKTLEQISAFLDDTMLEHR
jgi:hypothetical protein